MSTEPTRVDGTDVDWWRHAAVALAIITAICAGFAVLFWARHATTTEETLHRVQIIGACVALSLAIVTLFTVVWRGLISAEQARLQQKQLNVQQLQIDKLSEQIAETSKNNLALLLQKGAELISDLTKPAQNAAGLATLAAVANDSNEGFAQQAVDLIADFIAQAWSVNHESKLAESAINTLSSVWFSKGRFADRFISIDGTGLNVRPSALPVYGASNVYYDSVELHGIDISTNNIPANAKFSANNVHFFASKIDFRNLYNGGTKNEFDYCSIASIRSSEIVNSKFFDCDFSECIFRGRFLKSELDLLLDGHNYYVKDHPPIFLLSGQKNLKFDEFLEQSSDVRQIF